MFFVLWVVLGGLGVKGFVHLALRLGPVCNKRSGDDNPNKSCMLDFVLRTCAEDFKRNSGVLPSLLEMAGFWEPENPWNFVLCPEIRAHVHEGT